MAQNPNPPNVSSTDPESYKKILNILSEIDKVRSNTLTTEENLDIIFNRLGSRAAKFKEELIKQRVELEDTVNKYKQILQARENISIVEKELLEINEKFYLDSINQVSLSKDEKDLLEEKRKKLKQIYDLANEDDETLKKQIAGQEKTLKGLETKKSLMDKISTIGRSFVNDVLESQIVKTFTIAGGYQIIKNQLSAVVAANQEFAKTTGMIASEIVKPEAVAQLGAYGVGVADLTRTTGALVTSMVSFTNQTPQVQSSLAATAAKFENLNVSAAESGAVFDIFTKTLNIAGEDAGAAMETMAKTAKGIGMAPAAMIKDFNAVMPQLAANGKKAQDVFYGLEKQAKSLGMSIGDLVSIAEGFDTFEGAAQKAAVLNSILGDNYLNSLELVQANEQERIELIKQGFDLSGRQFADMDRATQKSIAQSLGFKNAGDAAKYFNTSTADMRIEQMKTEATQAKLNEAMAHAADIGKQLASVYNQLVIFLTPLLEKVKNFIIKVVELNEASGGLLVPIALLLVLIPSLVFVVGSMIAPLITAGAAILSFGTKSAAASPGIAAAITAITTAISTGLTAIGTAAGNPKVAGGLIAASAAIFSIAAALMALGLAVTFIGAGIGLAAVGLSMLVESFKGLGEQTGTVALTLLAFVIVFGIFVFALIKLAIPAAGAAGVLMVLGIAVASIGAGIFLAATGMAQFVNSIKALADKKADIREAMDIFSEVGGVMIHMQNVNQVFVDMVNNIKLLVTQLGVLKTALNGISVNASGNFTANLKAVSDSILLPQGDVTAFVDSTNSVAKVLNAAASVTTEKVNISKDFIKEIFTISNSQSVTNNNTTKQGQPNIKVQVFLDSKEIASKIKTKTDDRPASELMNGRPSTP
jgi:hypothetical protein